MLGPGLRRAALTAHVGSSVGWLGAVAGFLALAVAGSTSQNAAIVRAAYPAMEVITRFVIVPLALAAVLTGVVSSLGNAWGLFRHYWVVAKLLVTVLATVVLLLQLPAISYLADAAAQTALAGGDLREARLSLVVHAGGGLLVLLVPTALAVYKPRGVTRYGHRKQRQRGLLPVPE